MKFLMIFIATLFSGNMVFAESAEIHLTVKDSKIFFSQKAENFNIQFDSGKKQEIFDCRNRGIYLSVGQNLLEGWDPHDFGYEDFKKDETAHNAYGQYYFYSCRDQNTQVLLWYQDQKSIGNISAEFWGEIDHFFIQDDFDNSKHELVVEKRDLLNDKAQYFSCKEKVTKKQIGETEKYVAYDVATECKELESFKKTGLTDFIYSPGVFAAYNSYRPQILPPVASTKSNFEKVTEAFLAKIPEGRYSGIMSAGTKTCDLEVSLKKDVLTVKHTITSSAKPRTRILEFTAADLIGFVEGDVYEDPIRVEETAIGTFSAAEFINPKNGESIWIRFEKNENREGQILRINGSEAYCRRLQAQ